MSLEPSGSLVLDTSVVIKWFRTRNGGEVLQEQALELRRAYLDGRLLIYVPDLLIYEMANALRYKPDMNESKVQQALQSLFGMGIVIERIDPEVIGGAVDIAYFYGVTVYDAVFVALAGQLQAGLVTADGELAQKLHSIPYIHHLADLTLETE
jgi:predicted nucleic acid-binding protein